MPTRVVILVLIVLKVITLLLYRIVREVHEQVIYVPGVLTGRLVLLGGKAGQTLLVHEHAERVHAVHQCIDPQIELEPVY